MKLLVETGSNEDAFCDGCVYLGDAPFKSAKWCGLLFHYVELTDRLRPMRCYACRMAEKETKGKLLEGA